MESEFKPHTSCDDAQEPDKAAKNTSAHKTGSTDHAVAVPGDGKAGSALFSEVVPLVRPSQEAFTGSQLEQIVHGPPLESLSQPQDFGIGPSQDLLASGTQNTQASQSIAAIMAEAEQAARQRAAAALKDSAVEQQVPTINTAENEANKSRGSNDKGADAGTDPAAAAAGTSLPSSVMLSSSVAGQLADPAQLELLKAFAGAGKGVLPPGLPAQATQAAQLASTLQAMAPSALGAPVVAASSRPSAMLANLGARAIPTDAAAAAAMAAATSQQAAHLESLYLQQQQLARLQQQLIGSPQQYPASAMHQQRHASVAKPEHAGSVAKRRGPMDEMRQLQRILTKLLPASAGFMPSGIDGGGNKVQADQIKIYLAATLGEAPKPDWGLKHGWGQYLADLFNWATGRQDITNYQAMDCARRQQGRSWEVLYDKLMTLGVYSWNWELPLRLEQVRSCPKGPPPELQRQQAALAAATAAAAYTGPGSSSTKRGTPAAAVAAAATADAAATAGQQQGAGYGVSDAGYGASDEAARAVAAASAAVASIPPAAAVTAAVAAESERAAKSRRVSRATSSGGSGAVAGAASAAAAAAAVTGSSMAWELPSQAELAAASCSQIVAFVSRVLQLAALAMQAKAASSAADPLHNHSAVMEAIANATNLFTHFATTSGKTSKAHENMCFEDLKQQQVKVEQAEASGAAAAAVSAAIAGGPVAASAGGQHLQQEQQGNLHPLQQLAQLLPGTAGASSSLQAVLQHAVAAQQAQLLAAAAAVQGASSSSLQDRAAAAAMPAADLPAALAAAAADGSLANAAGQQQQQGLDNAAGAAAAAAAAPEAAAAAAAVADAGAGVHEDDEGEEVALPSSHGAMMHILQQQEVHPAALGPDHAAIMAAAAAAAAAAATSEDRAYLAALTTGGRGGSTSRGSYGRKGTNWVDPAGVAARAYHRSRQQQQQQRSHSRQQQWEEEDEEDAAAAAAAAAEGYSEGEDVGLEKMTDEDVANVLRNMSQGHSQGGQSVGLGSPSKGSSSRGGRAAAAAATGAGVKRRAEWADNE